MRSADSDPAAEGNPAPTTVIDGAGLQALIDALRAEGLTVIGPRFEGGVPALGEIARVDQLPLGVRDEPEPGAWRARQSDRPTLFDVLLPAQGWKRYLYPPSERLWRARATDDGFELVDEALAVTRYAFLGVRACDLRALQVLDRVLTYQRHPDAGYTARRQAAWIITVPCTRPGDTCFCASLGSGPRARGGFDLALTELPTDARAGPRLLLSPGSRRGARLAARLQAPPASGADLAWADAACDRAAGAMGRAMVPDVAALICRHLEHPLWAEVAERCLGCANCTLVCPTCFCGSVEDVTDLAGGTAERWRAWDSCFTLDFSYLHGGGIRRVGAARYRQWMAHKLGFWWEQFGTSGCVGCGRCITWCPVGIDITAEARALHDREGGH